MADSVTPNFSWAYPTNGGDTSTWGNTLNATIIAIDADLFSVSQSKQASLGFVPVQQGGGYRQGNAQIQIGEDTGGASVRAAVGGNDFGSLVRTMFNGGGNPGGTITFSTSTPSGACNDGDQWIQYS